MPAFVSVTIASAICGSLGLDPVSALEIGALHVTKFYEKKLREVVRVLVDYIITRVIVAIVLVMITYIF